MIILDYKIVHQTEEKNFGCLICDKTYDSKKSLNRHTRTKHDELNPHKCETCLLSLSSESELNRHKQTENHEKELNKGFTTKGQLKSHQVTHTKKRKHKCDMCATGRFFKTNEELTEHMKYHTKPTYQCQQCEEKFYTSSVLKRHKKTHLC